MQGYDYEDWSKRPTKTSKFGSILAHDNSGPDSWTTESRFEYRNPVQRRDALIETGQWPYGREEEVCGKINGRRVRGGREEFLYLHPMPVHVSPTHEEDYLRSIEPRPPHEAVPPYMLPREEEEKEPHFTSPYASEDIVDRQPPSSSENSSSSSHLPPREIPSASSSPPHHPYAYPSPYGSELHAPSASPNVRFAEKG
ncbi:hypothetical protein CSUI_007481 [Cystoisospora suis]|uniref:Uncharacterized protein n=1 Tax=Cystoisospora suis TaxID=483139 RepID=A0A2C6KQU3_9APIC|nr:hypothetical protein CSUI_007481 [Cystoisospora suis]